MKTKWILLTIPIVIVLLVTILPSRGSTEYEILAGKISLKLNGSGNYWVDPSSVKAKQGHIITIKVYNGDQTSDFKIEKVAPYDAELKDASESIQIDIDYLEIGGRSSSTFTIRVVGGQKGESWIRITPDKQGMVQQALIVRVKID